MEAFGAAKMEIGQELVPFDCVRRHGANGADGSRRWCTHKRTEFLHSFMVLHLSKKLKDFTQLYVNP